MINLIFPFERRGMQCKARGSGWPPEQAPQRRNVPFSLEPDGQSGRRALHSTGFGRAAIRLQAYQIDHKQALDTARRKFESKWPPHIWRSVLCLAEELQAGRRVEGLSILSQIDVHVES
jgi:hypothetical protein